MLATFASGLKTRHRGESRVGWGGINMRPLTQTPRLFPRRRLNWGLADDVRLQARRVWQMKQIHSTSIASEAADDGAS
jgi:hypothetical protein